MEHMGFYLKLSVT